MNKTELIAAAAEKSGLSKKDTESALNAAIDGDAPWRRCPWRSWTRFGSARNTHKSGRLPAQRGNGAIRAPGSRF